MPPVIDLLHPRRMSHVVVGMGAPMEGAATPETLAEPMRPGAYGLVTMNRKTVVRCLIMPIDECNIDLEAIAAEQASIGLNPDSLNRLRASWFVTQFSYESYDPQVFASIRFLFRLVDRLAELTGGIIADPLAQRYLKPGTWYQESYDEAPVRPQELVSIVESKGAPGPCLRTFGMAKFDHPDFAVELPSPEFRKEGELVLHSAIGGLLKGKTVPHALYGQFTCQQVEMEPEVIILQHRHPHPDFPAAFAAWHEIYQDRES